MAKRVYQNKYSDHELLNDVLRVYKLLGEKGLSKREYDRLSKFGMDTVIGRFGSWNKAKQILNLPITESCKHKKKESPRKPSAKLRVRVLKRDGFRCVYCGHGVDDGAKLQVDHIHLYSRGGLTVEENLQVLCSLCNIGKGAD